MKKLICLSILFISTLTQAQQQYAGYRSSNYTGVNGVFFNPASIADSRYNWDLNILAINVGGANNNVLLNGKAATYYDLDDDYLDRLLQKNGSRKINAFANTDILGPSFMLKVNPKTSFAISTRLRVLSNVKDFDGTLAQGIETSASNSSFPYNISVSNRQSYTINAWYDLGLSMGRILSDKGKHFFKAGITVKYIAGMGNNYVNINELNGTMNKDGSGNYYLSSTTASLTTGVGGRSFDDRLAKDIFKAPSTGVGGDLGFIYEYRPDWSNTNWLNHDKYKFRVSVALMDIGFIRYKVNPLYSSSYAVLVAPAQQLYVRNLAKKSVTELKSYFDENPYFTDTRDISGKYNVELPATLQAGIDWNLGKRFYVDLSGQIALHDDDNYQNAYYQHNITLTPRYEGKFFGVYVPVNYNTLSDFNAGLSLRVGPLFVGSGSFFTMLAGESKQTDLHIGLRIGKLSWKKKGKEIKPGILIPPGDTDGDGITNDVDKCPSQYGTAKYDGCPVPDSDGDGINDEQDQCPDRMGTAAYKGCPVPDSDGDGINDTQDKCPYNKGIVRYNGCPVPDTDGDGVNDEEDRCPSLAGVAANKGCPEVKEEIKKKIDVAARHILFSTGKTILLRSSYSQLSNVAQLMKEDKDLKLEIEGHTDNTGDDQKNIALSEKRAEAVKTYLVKQGVEESRINSKGLGETMPVADNKTATGRAKNRRVEMMLHYD